MIQHHLSKPAGSREAYVFTSDYTVFLVNIGNKGGYYTCNADGPELRDLLLRLYPITE